MTTYLGHLKFWLAWILCCWLFCWALGVGLDRDARALQLDALQRQEARR